MGSLTVKDAQDYFADNDKRDMQRFLGIEDVENILGPYKARKK